MHTQAAWAANNELHHPLFDVLGMSIYTVMPDVLHILDLGVAQRLLGNTLFHLVFTAGFVAGCSSRFYARPANLTKQVVCKDTPT